ncbi:ABC transporter permease [Dactylosporangium aurantiacum]|uniref:ABC transporter permease n=1 Tax=Dactylosporangium aurantiacum TaxID=35754 RepID=A0A9Q9MGI8_9ACTN|nr:ABC transporter permease [Dactylosporangium aurantiacum]MDG6106153.1 ABC transporter permease [Dactylosporangium aurantiacum]UWZ58343.1 ABC transporter permease [Dactylosporangium aurantiacum]
MMWLTWRQHRKQALYTVLGLAALAAFIVPTGLAMHRDFDRLVVRGCPASAVDTPCDGFHEFATRYDSYIYVCVLLLVVPLLFGLFWGAPLVARELEQGTHRMIWTQGVSRRHWALAKVGLLGGAVTVLAVVYGLGISWWYEPLAYTESRFQQIFFDVQGVAPVGYSLFAVALGIAAGVLSSKVVPAMGLTLSAFIAARIVVALFVRPRLATPVTNDFPVVSDAAANLGQMSLGSWVLSSDVRRPDGTIVTSGAIICAPDDAAECLGGFSAELRNHQVYQPGERFWWFQWAETGIFVALAVLLVWLAVRRIRRIA